MGDVSSKYKDHLDSRSFVPLKEVESLAAHDEKTSVRGVLLEAVASSDMRYEMNVEDEYFSRLSPESIAENLGEDVETVRRLITSSRLADYSYRKQTGFDLHLLG